MLSLYILGTVFLVLRGAYKYGEELDEDFDKPNRLFVRIGTAFLWPLIAAPYVAFRFGEHAKEKSSLPEARVLPRLK